MNAKELNEIFMGACEQCPQCSGFDDQEELVDGQYVDVANLGQKGIVAVIKYWRNENTIGGHILHDMGYVESLPDEVLDLLDNIDKLIEKAIMDAVGC